MTKTQLTSLLLLMTAISGITYYTQNDHTTILSTDEEKNIYSEWVQWQNAFGKNYKSEEIPLKFATFSKNYNFVKNFDPKKERRFTVGLNRFADLTSEEFVSLHKQGKLIDYTNFYSQVSIPNSVNWEANGVLPAAQDQGQCGSSSVIAAVQAIEGLYYIVHGQHVQFSVQQVIDCIQGGSGCNGGIYPDGVYQYATQYGLESAGDYPYVAQQGTCQYDPSKVIFKLSGYTVVQTNSTEALLNAVAKQPVTALIEADAQSFQLYTGGIYDDPNCGTNLDTAIVIAGYQQGSQNYWIVQNSWGTAWGLNGNIYIAFDPTKTNDSGICGINMDASYPNA